jgi:AcrR family transcriptional regulator
MAIMPSVTRSRREPADKSGVETQIMDAVDRLLRRGEKYTEISVQRILTEAGLSRATFYSHFRDKVDLITRMVDKLREKLLGMAADLDFGDSEDGAARFSSFLLASIRVQRSSGTLLAALREVATYDSTVRDFYTEDLEGFDEVVRREVVAQQQAGRTPPDVNAAAASLIIAWGGEQAIARHIAIDDGSGDEEFARELGAVWWYGVYRRPPGGR